MRVFGLFVGIRGVVCRDLLGRRSCRDVLFLAFGVWFDVFRYSMVGRVCQGGRFGDTEDT